MTEPADRSELPGYIHESDGWLLAAAIVIGIAAAFANFIFHAAIEGAHFVFWGSLGGALGIPARSVTTDVFADGTAALGANWWLIPLVPMSGMALLVLLDRWFPGEIHGYGLPRFLEIVNVRGGYIRRRWITLKTITGAITLGSGMSAGVEGPVAQIGGAIGSTVSRLLRPSPERLRVLIASGTAAAIASTFGAPIAGVMFAEEIVLLGQSQLQSLTLLVVAACVATITSQYLTGYHQVLAAPHFEFPINHELVFYLLLGIASGPVAVAFLRGFYAIKDWVGTSAIPVALRPVAGAVIVGSALVLFPQIGGSGYDVINQFFLGEMGARLLLSLALVKLVMTGVTLGFGGSGGVFAPAMFIGAAFGAGFAVVVNHVLPGSIAHPGAFGLVGMGTLLAAATHAPMTAIFLLFELTRDYSVVVPIMITAITATTVARQLVPTSIDEYDLARRGLHLHSDGRTRVLRQFFVHSLVARDITPVRENASVAELVRTVSESRHAVFPVVDDDDGLVGTVGMVDLRAVLLESHSWADRSVRELVRRDGPVLRLGDSLYDALQMVVLHGVEEIVVVEDKHARTVAGLLNRSELQSFYQKRLLAREMVG
ncbi:MAG TPA: chloride channel protein [Candidatus Limnocylindrales bacterium]|nr:chloride channel protein [Candidatus Limnocylindrales bacterium]